MNLLTGITYNIRGLLLGIKTPRLLFLGLIRFFVIIGITIVAAGVVLFYHNEILSLLWAKPQSLWIIWLWHLAPRFQHVLVVHPGRSHREPQGNLVLRGSRSTNRRPVERRPSGNRRSLVLGYVRRGIRTVWICVDENAVRSGRWDLRQFLEWV